MYRAPTNRETEAYRAGDAVHHRNYGPGVVVSSGDGRVVVEFGGDECGFSPNDLEDASCNVLL